MSSIIKIDKIELSLFSITTSQALHLKFKSLDLFFSSDLSLDYMLLHCCLNTSMLIFLKCIHQLSKFIKITSSVLNSLVNNIVSSVLSTKSGRKE